MIHDDGVVVSTVVDVDPETAFEVFTREVDRWWRSGPRFRPGPGPGEMRFEEGVGGRLLQVDDADQATELARIRVWEPRRRIVLDMRGRDLAPGESTEVEVRFEPTGTGTRVTVAHRGFEALGPDHPVRHGLGDEAFRASMGLFWADLLTALRRHAHRRGAPDA